MLGKNDGLRMEQYVATTAYPGTYTVLIRRATGEVTAGIITAQVTVHKGTSFEETKKRQLSLVGDELLFEIELPTGRRLQPVAEAQVAQDIVVQQELSRTVLAQQLAALSDEETVTSLSDTRPKTQGQRKPFRPYSFGGPLGYQPVISVLAKVRLP